MSTDKPHASKPQSSDIFEGLFNKIDDLYSNRLFYQKLDKEENIEIQIPSFVTVIFVSDYFMINQKYFHFFEQTKTFIQECSSLVLDKSKLPALYVKCENAKSKMDFDLNYIDLIGNVLNARKEQFMAILKQLDEKQARTLLDSHLNKLI